ARQKQRQYNDIQSAFEAQERLRPRTAKVTATMNVLQEQLIEIASDLNRMKEIGRGFQPAVQVLRHAEASPVPVSPLPVRDAGLAALIAMLLAGAAAWGFEAQSQRRTDPGRFARLVGTVRLG